MCTVSFVKHKEGFSLTSNRDEQKSRPTDPPKIYGEYKQNLIYPKDQKAGGTWIATSDRNITVCLLNGAFSKHKHNPPYAKSRGIVLKERFVYSTNQKFIDSVNLVGVEPFTLLLIDHNDKIDFKVLVWDGKEKYIENVNPNQNRIWASSTLYGETERKNRKIWFKKYIEKTDEPNPEDLLKFHTGSFTSDKENDIVMQRGHDLKTVSVSQINVLPTSKIFIYKDLEDHKIYTLNSKVQCEKV